MKRGKKLSALFLALVMAFSLAIPAGAANWDEDLTGHFRRFAEMTSIRSSRNRRVYVLTNYGSTHEQDLYRVNTLRALGYDPYVMIYERPTAPKITRHLQRWVNNKRIFHSVKDFKDYRPVKKED